MKIKSRSMFENEECHLCDKKFGDGETGIILTNELSFNFEYSICTNCIDLITNFMSGGLN